MSSGQKIIEGMEQALSYAQGAADELEACCKVLQLMAKDRQMMKLHLGEMTAQESRTLIAGLHLAEEMIRRRHGKA